MQNASVAVNGWDLAERGMAAAVANANRESEDWSVRAASLFAEFVSLHPGESFMTEDVREWAEAIGLPKPPDRRAWGAVAIAAKRNGLVRSLGYAPQKSANAHRAPKTLWVGA